MLTGGIGGTLTPEKMTNSKQPTKRQQLRQSQIKKSLSMSTSKMKHWQIQMMSKMKQTQMTPEHDEMAADDEDETDEFVAFAKAKASCFFACL